MAKSARASGSGKKPRMIGKGAVGPVTHAPAPNKGPLRLPGQPIPGNKVPKAAGTVVGNPKVKRPLGNTTGSSKIKGKTVGY